ncbi:MAG: 30S ribosomal protein S5, partial [Planctomycetota bacterium]|nr:30S ribosomal protein S5 [Planctomycetota bacterium]
VRAVLEMAGVRDVLTKLFGSTNPTNAVKATLDGLRSMRSKVQVEKQRGMRIV